MIYSRLHRILENSVLVDALVVVILCVLEDVLW